MSTLAGASIARVELYAPRYGSWWAGVVLADGAAVPGKVSLVVADLTLSGTIPAGRAGLDEPDRWRAVVVGAPGWDTPLRRALSYQTDAAGGVRLKTVLADLARACGETLLQPADASLGAAWSCPASTSTRRMTGRDALAALAAAGVVAPWWVDGAGTTRFDARPTGPAVGEAQARPGNAQRGVQRLALGGTLAGFLPGRTYGGSVIDRLVARETGGALTAELWS